MATYKIELDVHSVLRVGFGDPAQNDQIVRDVHERLAEMVANRALRGGPIIRINGPASLPVACVLTHALAHIYETVAVFDPKLAKYVVAVAHGGPHCPGDLID